MAFSELLLMMMTTQKDYGQTKITVLDVIHGVSWAWSSVNPVLLD
jgi:hypothetical protein